MSKKLLAAILILFLLQGCKMFQKLDESHVPRNYRKIINNLEEKQVSYTTLYAKARVTYKGNGTNQSASVLVKAVKDSLIWGSVSVLLGLEVGRVFITADEVVILDRFNKKYYKYPYSFIQKSSGIQDLSFPKLFDLITGNTLFSLQHAIKITTNKGIISFEGSENGMKHITYVDEKMEELAGYLIESEKDKWKSEITYRQKINDGDKSIPKIMEAKVFLPEESYLHINYFQVQFDKKSDIDTQIPADYELVR